jgi:hypothetical protein
MGVCGQPEADGLRRVRSSKDLGSLIAERRRTRCRHEALRAQCLCASCPLPRRPAVTSGFELELSRLAGASRSRESLAALASRELPLPPAWRNPWKASRHPLQTLRLFLGRWILTFLVPDSAEELRPSNHRQQRLLWRIMPLNVFASILSAANRLICQTLF